MRKIPMRKCVVTQERFPKKDLIRVVRTPEKTVDTASWSFRASLMFNIMLEGTKGLAASWINTLISTSKYMFLIKLRAFLTLSVRSFPPLITG